MSQQAATLYGKLRQSYPNARIVAIGYPYLFPGGRAGLQPNDCASILRRFSLVERTGIRALSDQLNNALYRQLAALVACSLDLNRQPPNAFVGGQPSRSPSPGSQSPRHWPWSPLQAPGEPR